MQQLLLHKYTPRRVADYKVNRAVVEVIINLVNTNTENVILYGPPITGKTTILKTIINEYYVNMPPELVAQNVLHINNLTEQGIQYYRNEVKTFCQMYSSFHNNGGSNPNQVRHKKMLIMDDFDTISEQSQQVFRNFIEKYSHNIIFIFTCTTIQNIIDNIQSHMQIIQINKPLMPELANFIDYIQQSENIQITQEAKDFILKLADGSIQLLFHYMEKFYILGEPITLESAQTLCSHISFYVFNEYIALVRSGNITAAVAYIYAIYDKGYSVLDILDTFFVYVKTTNTLSEPEKYTINEILCKYIAIFYNIHEDEIELALLTNNLMAALGATPPLTTIIKPSI